MLARFFAYDRPHRALFNQKTGHLVGRLTTDLEEIGEVAHTGRKTCSSR